MTKKKGLSCEDCSWKDMKIKADESFEPCKMCIRSSNIVSSRWKGSKTIIVRGIKLAVPRDMYISKDMLEFIKAITTSLLLELMKTRKAVEFNKYKTYRREIK